MVHLRLNERQSNPNPYINFTTPLPSSPPDEASALSLLRALSAQVRPIMKKHGLTVNSLEEYPPNPIFAGRNWNAGETIELVLRRPSSPSFLPTTYLLSTLTHELAHIKHMNHSPAFHSLWNQLRSETLALQRRGYFGDGYYSSGRRVGDSEVLPGIASPVGEQDLPEYTCGGAQSAPRPRGTTRRRRRPAGPQTARRRKPGARVRTGVFAPEKGGGTRLDGRAEDDKGGEGSTFRKRATSRKAKQERADAAERRLRALQGLSTSKPSPSPAPDEEDSDSDDASSDDDTRIAAIPPSERDALRTRPSSSTTGRGPIIIDLTGTPEDELPDVSDMLDDLSSSDDDGEVEVLGEDYVTLPTSARAHVQAPAPATNGKGKRREDRPVVDSSEERERGREAKRARPAPTPTPISASAPTQEKRPPLDPSAHPPPPAPAAHPWSCPSCTFLNAPIMSICEICDHPRARPPAPTHPANRHGNGAKEEEDGKWACGVCTFGNARGAGKCGMCDSPRGGTEWVHRNAI